MPYFHVVFTLPHELSALVLQNKRLLYDLLFRASAATLLEVARDPKHLGADIGCSASCTPGDRTCCIIRMSTASSRPAVSRSMAPDGSLRLHASSCLSASQPRLPRQVHGCFEAALYFRASSSFHGSLQELARPERFRLFLRQLFAKDWVVYAKPPFGGPEHVLHYLARYTHRVAISNHRLVASRRNASPSAGRTTLTAASRRS